MSRFCIIIVASLFILNGQSFAFDPGASATAASKPTTTTAPAAAAQWIACSSTKELTRAVKAYVEPGDRVVELGAALRETSTSICEAIGPGGEATLVDVKRSFPKRDDAKRTTAMRREGDDATFYVDRSKFVEIDSFSCWKCALFFGKDDAPLTSYDVLVADVSSIVGNDLDLQAVSLVKEFMDLNDNMPGQGTKCRVVIVKSGSLSAWARRLVHAQRLFADNIHHSVRSRLAQKKQDDDVHAGSKCFIPPIVVGTVGVEEYRRTIPYTVKKGDAALEVGCHLGTSTVEIHNAALDQINGNGGCIGVDIGNSIVDGAKARYPDVPFAVADAWHTMQLARLRRLLPGYEKGGCVGYDVVYVDVGGLSGSDGLLDSLSLINALGMALEPRVVVIKSQCLRRLAGCLIPFSSVWQSDEEMRRRIE